MKDGEADILGLLRDARVDEGASDGDATATGVEDVVTFSVHIEAEELAVFRVRAEDGADGVVGADLLEADAHRGDGATIDLSAVADFGDVALRFREDGKEVGLER